MQWCLWWGQSRVRGRDRFQGNRRPSLQLPMPHVFPSYLDIIFKDALLPSGLGWVEEAVPLLSGLGYAGARVQLSQCFPWQQRTNTSKNDLKKLISDVIHVVSAVIQMEKCRFSFKRQQTSKPEAIKTTTKKTWKYKNISGTWESKTNVR